MEVNKKKIFKLDIMFFVVLLAVGFYFFWKSAPEATAPANEDNLDIKVSSSSDLPEGVVVTDLGDGNKLVINDTDKYTVKVSDDIYLYKDFEGDLKLQDYEEPKEAYGGAPGCSVSIISDMIKTSSELKLEEENNCKNIVGPDCESVHLENVKYNNIDWIKIYSHGTFVGTDNPLFINFRENDMLNLYFSCSNKNFIDNVLNNFSF